MRSFNTNSPVLRSSVASVSALAVVSLLAWSFEAYRNHLWETRSPAIASIGAQYTAGTPARDA